MTVGLRFNVICLSDNPAISSADTTDMTMMLGTMHLCSKTITGLTGIMTVNKDTLPSVNNRGSLDRMTN